MQVWSGVLVKKTFIQKMFIRSSFETTCWTNVHQFIQNSCLKFIHSSFQKPTCVHPFIHSSFCSPTWVHPFIRSSFFHLHVHPFIQNMLKVHPFIISFTYGAGWWCHAFYTQQETVNSFACGCPLSESNIKWSWSIRHAQRPSIPCLLLVFC